MEIIKELLNYVLYTTIVALVPILGALVGILIKKMVDKLQNNINNDTINQYIDTATEIVTNAVIEVSQTYVDALKKADEFTIESQKEAFNKAKETAMNMIDDVTKSVIEAVYQNYDKWLANAIEVAVKRTK